MAESTTKAADIVDSSLDPKSEVKETGLTVEWVLGILLQHNPRFAEAKGNSKVKKLSAYDVSEGKGFCSRIHRTTVEFVDPEHPSYSFVMKIPTDECILKLFESIDMNSDLKKNLATEILAVHNVECETYTWVQEIPDFPLPEVFYSEKHDEENHGVIVMEDLSEKAASIGCFRSVTVGQCLNFARHIADLQAHVELKLKEADWKGRYEKNIHVREEYASDFAKGINPLLDLKNGELKKEFEDMLLLDWFRFSAHCVVEKAKEYNAITLCHGDCWTNNVMLKLSEDGSLSDQIGAFIDWQTLFEGSALFDLARFLVISADGDVRRDVEQPAVDLFYDRLSEKLTASGRKPRFTREQAHELYEVAAAHQTCILAAVISLIALPAVKASGSKVDEAKFEKIWLRVRLACEDQQALFVKHGLLSRFTQKEIATADP